MPSPHYHLQLASGVWWPGLASGGCSDLSLANQRPVLWHLTNERLLGSLQCPDHASETDTTQHDSTQDNISNTTLDSIGLLRALLSTSWHHDIITPGNIGDYWHPLWLLIMMMCGAAESGAGTVALTRLDSAFLDISASLSLPSIRRRVQTLHNF